MPPVRPTYKRKGFGAVFQSLHPAPLIRPWQDAPGAARDSAAACGEDANDTKCGRTRATIMTGAVETLESGMRATADKGNVVRLGER